MKVSVNDNVFWSWDVVLDVLGGGLDRGGEGGVMHNDAMIGDG